MYIHIYIHIHIYSHLTIYLDKWLLAFKVTLFLIPQLCHVNRDQDEIRRCFVHFPLLVDADHGLDKP